MAKGRLSPRQVGDGALAGELDAAPADQLVLVEGAWLLEDPAGLQERVRRGRGGLDPPFLPLVADRHCSVLAAEQYRSALVSEGLGDVVTVETLEHDLPLHEVASVFRLGRVLPSSLPDTEGVRLQVAEVFELSRVEVLAYTRLRLDAGALVDVIVDAMLLFRNRTFAAEALRLGAFQTLPVEPA